MKESPCNHCETRSTCKELCDEALGLMEGATVASQEAVCSFIGISNPLPLSVPATDYIKPDPSKEERHAKKRARFEKIPSLEGLTPRQKLELFGSCNTSIDMTQDEVAKALKIDERTLRRDLEKIVGKNKKK
jgi:hypothetical protein